MAIALHELCTNAAKYGALSNNTGKIDITWSVTGLGSDRKLQFHWLESNGPEVTHPGKRGFGARIIERTLSREHNAGRQWQF